MALNIQSTYFSSFRKVSKLLPKHLKKRLVWIQLLIIVTGFIDLVGLALFIPILSAVADTSVLEGDTLLAQLKAWSGVEEHYVFLVYMFVFAFIFFIFRTAFILFSNWLQSKFVFTLKEYIGTKTYNYYLNLDFEEFTQKDRSQVFRELAVSPQHFSVFIVKSLLLITSELVIFLMAVVGIAVFNFQVFILILVTIVPIAYLFNLIVKKKMQRIGKVQDTQTPILYRKCNRGVFGMVDIKLRQKEDVIIEDYLETDQTLNRASLLASVYAIFPAKLFELVTLGGLIIIFVYGAFMADNAAVILPLIALYAAAGYRVSPSLSKITSSLLLLQQYAYLFDIFTVPLKYELKHKKEKKDPPPLAFNDKVEMVNTNFRFTGGHDLLFEGLEFYVKKNEIIGLIGKSGSGKTTLVQILSGFLKPESGQMLVDGQEINEDNIVSWMKKISYVQQTPYLEQGSLAENIAFLDDDIDKERLEKAIQQASLSDLIEGTNAFDFQVQEQGKNLSGGQKQRVLIARALYHQSELLILDEATSALDNETENEINQTLMKIKGSGVTVIIIAHRYTTLKSTDRILVMENGKITSTTQYDKLSY